jgi:Protein of unknown function (DUF3551)
LGPGFDRETQHENHPSCARGRGGGDRSLGNPAAAQQSSNYQWCAQYDEGGTNCGFTTLSQCNEALSGNGGFCERRMGVAPIAAAPVTAGSSQRRRTTVGAAASQ